MENPAAHIQRGSTQTLRPFPDKLSAPTVTMAAGASAASAAATEHSDTTPLSQLLNQGSGQAGAYELKVRNLLEHSAGWSLRSHNHFAGQISFIEQLLAFRFHRCYR